MKKEYIFEVLNRLATNKHNLKRYCNIVDIFIQRNIEDIGTQNHHIIPRCILQDLVIRDTPENIVKLTPRQHKFVHVILSRAFPRHRLSSASKLPYASGFIAVYDEQIKCTIRIPTEDYYTNTTNRYQHPNKGLINLIHITSREKIRILCCEKKYYETLGYQHPNKGVKKPEGFSEKLRLANLGRVVTEKTKEKLSIINTGKIVSQETLKKMSIAQTGKNLGRVATTETRRKQSFAQTGKVLSKETKNKMSVTRKTIKWINDGVTSKRVQFDSLNEWFSIGFVLGRLL